VRVLVWTLLSPLVALPACLAGLAALWALYLLPVCFPVSLLLGVAAVLLWGLFKAILPKP